MSVSVFFTRAKEKDKQWSEKEGRTEEREQRESISGEEAKLFYQSLIGEGDGAGRGKKGRGDKRRSERGAHRRRQVQVQPRPSPCSERDGNKLLRSAQEGDMAMLKGLLGKGCDINFRDSFYWTALMCASFAGHLEVVRVLLQQGAAWIGVVDTQGRDARDLAEQAGHESIVRELELHGAQPENTTQTSNADSAISSLWCPDCECEYRESLERHQSSILHQFNLRQTRPSPTPHYCLPPSNAGYQIMLRSGWNPSAGLGPGGSGRKQPIRTVLKRDQTGLGYGPAPQAKVTHFQPKDPMAVRRLSKERTERKTTVSQRELRKKEERDRTRERDFRQSFNLDL
ncbi:G patch domain and ankyrin repeat-containing protein 1 [Chanos chanos]|uniref:G patch domain and ankyrin repeat-containing protein 1 n=1 Tax=Chanos chanos TaxID=29144 RepID=A0A6J2VWW4_CHACN|nr:G patch domain and ankyrin repeat-containing protein 1 [Chanos chanos]